MNLIWMLNQIGSTVYEKYPTVNSGGCCVYAAAIAVHLQRLGCPVRILVGDDSDEVCIDEIRPSVGCNTVEEWNNNGLYFGHVIVEFEYEGITYHYDCAGVTSPDSVTVTYGYAIVDGYLTVDEAVDLAACNDGWNSRFDRAFIPDIHKMINKSLSSFTL